MRRAGWCLRFVINDLDRSSGKARGLSRIFHLVKQLSSWIILIY
jgi:hypothetical protein